MTVRRDRNRAARRAALDIAAAYRCPDCNATTKLAEPAQGVLVLDVAHDPTCPAYPAENRDARDHNSEGNR